MTQQYKDIYPKNSNFWVRSTIKVTYLHYILTYLHPWFTIFLSAKLRVKVQTDVKLLLWFVCCKINTLNSYFGLIMKGCLTLTINNCDLQSHKRSYLVYTGNAPALLSNRLLGNYLRHFSDFKHGSPLTHLPKGLWQNSSVILDASQELQENAEIL